MEKPVPASCEEDIVFSLDAEDSRLLMLAVKRFEERRKQLGLPQLGQLNTSMSIAACHNHAIRIDFLKLHQSDLVTLAHDIAGICTNISHEDGSMLNNFMPKCALKEGPSS